MKFSNFCTTTVSLAAIMATAPALAQDRGIWIEATGAVVYGDNSAAESFIADTTTTDDFSISDLDGGFGSLYLGVPLSPTWDIAAGFSITSLSPAGAEYNEPGIVFPIVVPGGSGQVENDLDIHAFDIEIGYTPELDDNLDIRLFAGARGLHAGNDIFVTEDKIGGEFDESTLIESNYFGIGPRVGMDIANRFANTPFGISGSFAGAVIFGNSGQTITTDTGGGPTSVEVDDNRTVVNLEASIGLDYHFTEQASFTIGYRGEHFGNVSNVPGGEPESFTSHGPFVKAALSF